MLSQDHLRSIELLDKFLSETNSEQLREIVDRCAGLSIEGPTWSEYKESFDSCLDLERHTTSDSSIVISPLTYNDVVDIQPFPSGKPPDILTQVVVTNKKDLEKFSGSFFYIHLSHVRST